MRVQSWPQYTGEATTYTVDWSVNVGRLATSVVGVVWSVDSGQATISDETLSGSTASALITTTSEATVLIKLTATLADSQIDVFFFKIQVSDPQCPQQVSKY